MVELPEIKNISDIKECGWYRFGDAIVFADSVGLPEFKDYIMPPVKIIENGGCVQVFISKNNTVYCRAITESKSGDIYHSWINLSKLSDLIKANESHT
jgi:hypothetical protein